MRIRLFLLINILFLGLAAVDIAAQPLQRVTLSYSSSGMPSVDWLIAKERQFFREEGLDHCWFRCRPIPPLPPEQQGN